MPKDFRQLCASLCSQTDSFATQDAMRWLEEHPEAAEAPELICKIEHHSPDENAIDWGVEFLRKHPQHLESQLLYNAHSTISLKYQNLKASLNENSGEEISELHTLVRNEQLIELTEDWLKKYPHATKSVKVMRCLLRAAPTNENCDRARKWMTKTENRHEANNILALLIEYKCEPELVQSALTALRELDDSSTKGAEHRSKRYLANALLNFAPEHQARKEALSWWEKEMRSDRAHLAVQDITSALPNENIAKLAINYLSQNPTSSICLIIWQSLLIKNCTDLVVAACWNWLCENKSSAYWQQIYSSLVLRSYKNSAPLPAPAVTKAWDGLANRELTYGKYILQADRSERAQKTMLKLAQKLATSNLDVDDFMATLLEVDSSEPAITTVRQWISTKQAEPEAVRKTLLTLLEIAPTADLITTAQKLLYKLSNNQPDLVMLTALVGKTEALWALTTAHTFLLRENQWGFRNLIPVRTGELLLALLETGKADFPIKECAKNWLKFYSHEHREVADRLRQASH